jgi:hypothetical protein
MRVPPRTAGLDCESFGASPTPERARGGAIR